MKCRMHVGSYLLRTSSGNVAVIKLNCEDVTRPSGLIQATNLLASQTTVSFADTALLKCTTSTATLGLNYADSKFLGLKAVHRLRHTIITWCRQYVTDQTALLSGGGLFCLLMCSEIRRTQRAKCLTLNDVILSRQVRHRLSARRISQTHCSCRHLFVTALQDAR